jgi:hypothetical protein
MCVPLRECAERGPIEQQEATHADFDPQRTVRAQVMGRALLTLRADWAPAPRFCEPRARCVDVAIGTGFALSETT